MMHSDNKGLVLPPRVAPVQIVIIPIIFEQTKEQVLKKAREIKQELALKYDVEIDDRDMYSSGWKFNEWELKGVPLRIEIGPKDIEKNQAILVRRDTSDKEPVKFNLVKKRVNEILDDIQLNLFQKAKKFLDGSVMEVNDWDAFESVTKARKLAKAKFCGEVDCEDLIKDKTGGVTSRCVPLDEKKPSGKCVHCGKEANVVAIFGKNY